MKRKRFLALFALTALCLSLSCNRQPGDVERGEFSFVVISDIHVPSYGFPINQPLDEASLMQLHNQKRLQQFVNECMTLDEKPSFVMNNGDTGDAGWLSLLNLYRKLMLPLVDAGIPVYTVVGNHDLDYAGIAARDLAEIFDSLGPELIGCHGVRYSFDHNRCHFVVLNNRPVTGLIRLNPEDLAWLKTDLEAVDRDTPILLFLHANMADDDTHRIVELLQPFSHPVIFQGHKHTSTMDRWGGIPVVLTGSLYGGTPEAGSYRLVQVSGDGITVRTRDFADSTLTPGPPETVEFPKPGPQLHIIEPAVTTTHGARVKLAVETEPNMPGTVDYRFQRYGEWTPMQEADGRWEASADMPEEGGRHFLSFRFMGDNGAVVLAHSTLTARAEDVREIWSKDLGSAVMGTPAIWREMVIVPAIEGGVHALRIDSGDVVWHRNVDNGQLLGRIVTVGDVVYFGAGRTVYGCDAAGGKDVWQTTVAGTIVAGITPGEGRLFVQSGEHTLSCLDAGDGTILWEYDVPMPIMMNAATDGERVFFGAMDGVLRALDAASGKEVWRQQMSSPDDKYTTASFWPPIVAGNRVIVGKIPAAGEEQNIVAFESAAGSRAWSRRLVGGTYRLAVDPGQTRVFLYARQDNGSGVLCLSVGDGSLLWNQTGSPAMNAGIAEGNNLIVRDGYHTACLDTDTGHLNWKYKTSTGPQGSYYGPHAMAVSGDVAVIGTMDGHVLALKW